ncbi:MAG: phenylacetic acid degradation protein [Candidatus Hydrogenedentes bacterium]|nr:phenylacetic acid degradation protein [Candidatus Hydrogenedentota bacterium]
MRKVACFLLVLGLLCWGLGASAGLCEYLAKEDPTYSYEVVKSAPLGTGTVDLVKLTSQTWQGIPWTHWLSIIRPAEVAHADKALLLIAGGSNRAEPPSLTSMEAQVLGMIADKTKSVTAVLSQTPNQPLFDGRTEDGIIAYTYDKYLKGEGEDWPLLLPMVKGAVRAMDAVQQVAKEKYGQDVRQFVMTGASKRGWTTWLTAAADKRVCAIAPIVIDMLNLGKQAPHQLASYGGYSEQVEDYTTLKIQERLVSPEGEKLLGIVDPFSYRNDLTLPKLVLLGSNDPYWCVDSANLYYPELKGEKHLYYQANTGHDVSQNGIATIAQFHYSQLTGEALPDLQWAMTDGAMKVNWKGQGGKALLWQATSPGRDFRNSQWTSTALEGDGEASTKMEAPQSGWLAYYIEVQFPSIMGLPFGLSTQMQVTPDTYPHEELARVSSAGSATAR